MYCFSIWKQDEPKKLAFLFDPFPLPDSAIRLNLRIVRVLDSLFNPFHPYFSTIRSFSHVKEILGKFHFGVFVSLTIIELLVVISSNPILVNPSCQTNFLGLMEILRRRESLIPYVNSNA